MTMVKQMKELGYTPKLTATVWMGEGVRLGKGSYYGSGES